MQIVQLSSFFFSFFPVNEFLDLYFSTINVIIAFNQLLLAMKRLYLVVLIALVALSTLSCSKSKREKITDPVQQEALRTRDAEIPVDSLFTASSARKISSPFKKISFGKLFGESKQAYAESADKAARQKYAEKLEDEDKLKKEQAEKKAARADSTTLADYKASFYERLVVTGESLPGDGYSPSLTAYFMIVLMLFVIIFTIRVVKAFFVSPKKR